MTKREKQIYTLIRSNPNISQGQIAESLNISRASVAVHITHIMKKGYILGRQYILKDDPSILVIGACNIDIQGYSKNNMIMHDSNIGNVRFGIGGVGRNIAVNLKKLVSKTNFLTVTGKNYYSKKIIEDLEEKGFNTSNILKVNKEISVYLSILDNKNEMVTAISDMGILTELDKTFLKTKESFIEKAEIIILDSNLPKESLEYIASIKQDHQKLIIDTVSIEKAKKIKNILNKIDYLKTNRLELEALIGKKINGINEIKKICDYLIDVKKIKNIFVTLGSKGLIFANEKKRYRLSNPKNIEVRDVTGAGDIFTAAIAYGVYKNLPLEYIAKVAQTASLMKITNKGTDFNNFNHETLEEALKKYHNISLNVQLETNLEGEFEEDEL